VARRGLISFQDRQQGRSLVNAVVKIGVTWKVWNFLKNSRSISLSRGIQRHGICKWWLHVQGPVYVMLSAKTNLTSLSSKLMN